MYNISFALPSISDDMGYSQKELLVIQGTVAIVCCYLDHNRGNADGANGEGSPQPVNLTELISTVKNALKSE